MPKQAVKLQMRRTARAIVAWPAEAEDHGVTYRNGVALVRVALNPKPGQYVYNSGVYIFSEEDRRTALTIHGACIV